MYGLYLPSDVGPSAQTEDCGYEPTVNHQMDGRAVTPTTGEPTNPRFAGAPTDAALVRMTAQIDGERKLVAKNLLTKHGASAFAYCRTHCVIVTQRPTDGKWIDWCNGVHDNTGQNTSFPHPPFTKCNVVSVRPEDICDMDDHVARVTESLKEIEQTLKQGGAYEGGGTRDEITEDYKKKPKTRTEGLGTQRIIINEEFDRCPTCHCRKRACIC